MTPKNRFRLLVAVTLLGAIASILVAEFPGNISEDWRTVTEWNGNGGIYDHFASFTLPSQTLSRIALLGLLVIVLVLFLSVYVGMFFFWRFARLTNVILTILSLLIAPWAGLVVLLPIEAAFYDFTMLCEGAVIALSYSHPIRDYFESLKSPNHALQ